jgi:hypothetical protein
MKTRRIRRDRMRSNRRLSDASFQREPSAFIKAVERPEKLGSGLSQPRPASTQSAAELEYILQHLAKSQGGGK